MCSFQDLNLCLGLAFNKKVSVTLKGRGKEQKAHHKKYLICHSDKMKESHECHNSLEFRS